MYKTINKSNGRQRKHQNQQRNKEKLREIRRMATHYNISHRGCMLERVVNRKCYFKNVTNTHVTVSHMKATAKPFIYILKAKTINENV